MYIRDVSHEFLDVDALALAIEDFNTVFIRLASVEKLSFSSLSVLHTLARRGPMRLTDLLATEQIKQPALTSLVAKLTESGLVDRTPDPSDRRASLLSLTAAGERTVQSRHDSRVDKLTSLLDHLSDRDRSILAQCSGVLARIVELSAARESLLED